MSMNERRSVLIPVVPAFSDGHGRENGARLIEVYSVLHGVPAAAGKATMSRERDAKALDKYWDLVAAPLRTSGAALYRAGCAAVSAVRKLGVARPRAALYQRLRPQAWLEAQRLYAASPEGPTEGRSAELGLALALLMGASSTRYQSVIATGALTGPSQRLRADDVEILPVDNIPAKLKAVLSSAENGALPDPRSGTHLCFTPRHFEHQGGVHEVAGLPEVEQLERHGVKVVPVGWLSDAAAALGAQHARHLRSDRYLQAACVAGLSAVLCTLAWLWWQSAPIPLAFVPGASAAKAEPFHACFSKGGDYYIMQSVSRDGPIDVVRSGETLGWKVKVGDPGAIEARVASMLGVQKKYYVAHAMVAEYSTARIEVVPEPVQAGETLEWGWTLNERAETNALVLLVQRHRPFDADRLRERLYARFPNAAGDVEGARLDVLGAVNYLMARAPGAVKFVFQTRQQGRQCPI